MLTWLLYTIHFFLRPRFYSNMQWELSFFFECCVFFFLISLCFCHLVLLVCSFGLFFLSRLIVFGKQFELYTSWLYYTMPMSPKSEEKLFFGRKYNVTQTTTTTTSPAMTTYLFVWLNVCFNFSFLPHLLRNYRFMWYSQLFPCVLP